MTVPEFTKEQGNENFGAWGGGFGGFEGFFGGGGRSRRAADPNAPRRGDDMTFRLDIDFDEAIMRLDSYREFEERERESTCNLFKGAEK